MHHLPPLSGASGLTRRALFEWVGASLALAGVGGCAEPPTEQILPYATQPPEVTPGIPRYYATSMVLDGFATGLLVESHVGRPTKIEGNPDHPASLGATGAYEQASILGLYDPHRARALLERGQPRAWSAFLERYGLAAPRSHRWAAAGGAGLHLLLEPTSSPLVAELLGRVRAAYPRAQVHFHAPLAPLSPLEAARRLLGRPLLAQYDLGRADVVVALDADLLASGPFHLRYARQLAERRRVAGPTDGMSRLYVAEATPTPTGVLADHRVRARSAEVHGIALALLAAVVAALGRDAPGGLAAALPRAAGPAAHGDQVRAMARDLTARPGAGLVVAGDRQPPAVHVAAHLVNALLGNVGRTVWWTESPILEAGEPSHGLGPLVDALRAGAVETLVVLEGNPSYTAPADLELPRLLRGVADSVYLGLFENETARDCRWFVPAAHYLESWGDARARDGTLSPVQPLIRPLYGGRTVADVLAVLAGLAGRSTYDLLRETHARRATGDAAAEFEAALREGLVAGSAFPRADARIDLARAPSLLGPAAAPAPEGTLELDLVQDARVYDGRFADNPWLQELPDPMTKLTWDNAALVSPRTAARLGLANEAVVELACRGRTLRAPVLVQPGQADDAVSLALGYGRDGAEAVARGVGVNAFGLFLAGESPFFSGGLALTPVVGREAPPSPVMPPARRPARHRLAVTQPHRSAQGRAIVRRATLAEYREAPRAAPAQPRPVQTLYEPHRYEGVQWGMTIDLTVCSGCSACVVACQAENNVPVVGRDGVLGSREMHWLRIDRYDEGDPDSPAVSMLPMLCQHCERAPCEYVCPVNATVHSPDGLNEQVYNRCIGTRFCSNNCPYKVRRFNWFDYNADRTETQKMAMNPDVTVRARGVMEKCTFCVQRIRRHEIEARIEGRPAPDGGFTTACAQACPTGAIVFGRIDDPRTDVARLRRQPRAYAVLEELGTEPRVRYLARLTNPNPELT
ncbi:MAG TPA: 4Fe-4S dicluster domain-containing protein [Thermodesulfobacteriota bacterium]